MSSDRAAACLAALAIILRLVSLAVHHVPRAIRKLGARMAEAALHHERTQ